MLDKSPEPLPIIPEQSVFDTKVFSEKKTPSNRPKCPSPPLKTPPVSRLLCTPRYTPLPSSSSSSDSNFSSLHTAARAIPFSLNSTPPYEQESPNNNYSSSPLVSFRNPENPTPRFDNEFRLLGEVGSGSFSHVFKAQSLADGKVYAIKRSRHQFRGVWERERFLDEVRYASKLPPHPHILHYLDAWEEGGFLFIQTELCELGTLKDFMERSPTPLSEDLIWAFLLDMFLGIAHMHKHNLMHLDIKPANLFLTSRNQLKIGDFGLVQQRGFYDHDVEGDSRYMAPELLIEDKSLVGFPADIFCVGATAFEMAANVEMPTNGESWAALRKGLSSSYIPSFRSMELKSFISHLMAPSPENRPTAEQALSHSYLQKILRSREERKMMPPPSTTPQSTTPHNKALLHPHSHPNQNTHPYKSQQKQQQQQHQYQHQHQHHQQHQQQQQQQQHTPYSYQGATPNSYTTPNLSLSSPSSSKHSNIPSSLPTQAIPPFPFINGNLPITPSHHAASSSSSLLTSPQPSTPAPRILSFASPFGKELLPSNAANLVYTYNDGASFINENDAPSSIRQTPIPCTPNASANMRDLETKERGVLRRESLESATKYASYGTRNNQSSGNPNQQPPPSCPPSREIYYQTPQKFSETELPLSATKTPSNMLGNVNLESSIPTWDESLSLSGITPKKLLDMFNETEDMDD